MHSNRRGQDSRATSRWDLVELAYDLYTLTAFGEGDHGRRLLFEERSLIVRLSMNKD